MDIFLEDSFMLPLQSAFGFLNGFTFRVLSQYRWGYLVDGALGESSPLLHFLWWHSQSEKFFSVFNGLTPRVIISHAYSSLLMFFRRM